MMFLLLICCYTKSINKLGVIDYVEGDKCTLEIGSEIVSITGSFCEDLKEGDHVILFVKKRSE